MAYIWINPVTDRMYDSKVLNEFLLKHGYKRFDTSTDWLTVVREKYDIAVKQSTDTVMDVRCPKVKELLEEIRIDASVTFPDIHPILIHCGEEGSQRADLLDDEKMITTPCQALADMGNALELENTQFIPWRTFLEFIGEGPEGILPTESPIPTGFFSQLDIKTDSITGEEEIRAYFEKFSNEEEQKKVQLVEMLYCKDGCHNGDGIRP